LCNGAVHDEDREIAKIHNCKLETLMELIEGLSRQLALVFYNFKHVLVRIKKALKNQN